MRPRHATVVTLLTAAAVLVPVELARSQGSTSRHCTDPKAGRLVDGTYSGKFDVTLFFKGGEPQGNMSLTLAVNGTLKAKVRNASVEELTGKVNYKLGGAGAPSKFAVVGLNFDGGGPLKLESADNDGDFRGVAKIKAPGGVFAITPPSPGGNQKPLKTKAGGTGSGDLHITFMVDVASCEVMSGRFRSAEVDQTANVFQSQGFAFTGETIGQWRASTGKEMTKKIEELVKELQQGPPPGIVRVRDAESRRVGAIADRIKKGPPEEIHCLFKIWLQHAHKMLAAWVEEDRQKLRAYQGDDAGLQGLLKRALDADRQLSLLGMDICEEQLHVRLWDAMETALSRLLTKMAEGRAPIGDILHLLRGATLLGAVSPQLRENVEYAMKREAKKLADVYWNAYRRVRSAHKKDPCNPDLIAAFLAALTAERTYEMLGNGSLDRATAEGSRFAGCPSAKR